MNIKDAEDYVDEEELVQLGSNDAVSHIISGLCRVLYILVYDHNY